jgi:Arc/MetJ-type ribon-helix-helix transcriptional regulator
MREKKQVTARMTDQFAKDLNLIMACQRMTSATDVVQDAVHKLAEYYRHAMQRARQEV